MYRYLLQRVYKRNFETLNFFNSEDFLKTQYENLLIFLPKIAVWEEKKNSVLDRNLPLTAAHISS